MKSLGKYVLSSIIFSLVVIVIRVYKPTNEVPLTTMMNSPEEKQLETYINVFLESKVDSNDLGRENYFCSNYVFGYEVPYIYSWVYCSGFTFINEKVEQGTAFSAPVRLEYKEAPFHIIDWKRPEDGARYTTSFKNLFTQTYYPIATARAYSSVIQNLQKSVLQKAKAVFHIKTVYPELTQYSPQDLLFIEEDSKGLYLAFVQNETVLPNVQCFFYKDFNEIVLNGTSTFLKSLKNEFFSSKECKVR